MSLHKTHICVVKSLVKIAAVSWHSLRRFIKPAPGEQVDVVHANRQVCCTAEKPAGKKLHDINLINRHAILTVICACARTETRSCAKFSDVCTQPHNIR